MKELVESIAQNSGLSLESAHIALHTVSQFVKEKYPLLSHTIDSVLGTHTNIENKQP